MPHTQNHTHKQAHMLYLITHTLTDKHKHICKHEVQIKPNVVTPTLSFVLRYINVWRVHMLINLPLNHCNLSSKERLSTMILVKKDIKIHNRFPLLEFNIYPLPIIKMSSRTILILLHVYKVYKWVFVHLVLSAVQSIMYHQIKHCMQTNLYILIVLLHYIYLVIYLVRQL